MIKKNKDTPKDTQAGFVAIIGAPNAGKSTLLNAMVGQKISIVTHKVQTTRAQIKGIWTDATTQAVFIDTPGIFTDAKRPLEKAMVQCAWNSLEDVDLILFVVDASKKINDDVLMIVEKLKQMKTKSALVLNKVDQIKDKKELLELSLQFNTPTAFDHTFMISALQADRVADILTYLKTQLPKNPWFYPDDQVSDFSERFLSAEVTREKLFLFLHEEIPYNLTVETEAWENFDNGDIKIDQVIYVTNENQRKIILGKGGEMIKKVGQASRKELSDMFGAKVHLKLFVKVAENWMSDPTRFKNMGITT